MAVSGRPASAAPVRKRGRCLVGAAAAAALLAAAPRLALPRRGGAGRCALLPAPLTAPLARTQSSAPDRWLDRGLDVDLLQEPVERPISRYLHKYDDHYDRIAPDYMLQYRTAEQQFLYEGDFSLLVREYTDQGAIVQDAVTGIFGFVPEAEFGDARPEVGSVVQGARCIHMDKTIFQSANLAVFRMQTGVVFEWDRRTGEGYIMPTEGQDAWRMRRVLRRDILWHGSRQLYAGQWVQYDTALAHEVPIEPNDEPESPFALRVTGPEVHFTLKPSTGHATPSSRTLQPGAVSGGTSQRPGYLSLGDGQEQPAPLVEAQQEQPAPLVEAQQEFRMPAESGRPPPRPLSRAHPALQRFAEAAPALAEAESPPWLWEAPMLDYLEEYDEDDARIIPMQWKKMTRPKRAPSIMAHEVAVEKGVYWLEAQKLRGQKLWNKMKPQTSRKQIEMDSIAAANKRLRADIRERRRQKVLVAKSQRQRY